MDYSEINHNHEHITILICIDSLDDSADCVYRSIYGTVAKMLSLILDRKRDCVQCKLWNYKKRLQGQNLVQYKNVDVLVEYENWQLTGFTSFTK